MSEANSRRWQRDTVAGGGGRGMGAGGTKWTSLEFTRRRVSYLVDSSRGALPREPFDSSARPLASFRPDLPPGPQPPPLTVRCWQEVRKERPAVVGFSFRRLLPSHSGGAGGIDPQRSLFISFIWWCNTAFMVSLACMRILQKSMTIEMERAENVSDSSLSGHFFPNSFLWP